MNTTNYSAERHIAGERSVELTEWTCPVCGGGQTRRRVAEVVWRTQMPGPKQYDIVRCRYCNVVATDPMPTRAVLDAYYASYAPTQIDDFRDNRLVQLQAPLWTYLSKALRTAETPTILDYGFGAGAFVKYVARHTQARVFGADFSQQNIDQLQRWCEHSGVNIDTLDVGRRQLADFGSQRMNLITMFQVVEHLVNPVQVLGELASLQRSGDLLYLECPHQDAWFFRAKNQCRRLLSREFMYGSVSPPQHVLGFNRRSMNALLARCGYSTLEIGDYSVADGMRAPETLDWYPTPWEWMSVKNKRTALGFGKAIIRMIDVPLSRTFGLGGGLFALAVRN